MAINTLSMGFHADLKLRARFFRHTIFPFHLIWCCSREIGDSFSMANIIILLGLRTAIRSLSHFKHPRCLLSIARFYFGCYSNKLIFRQRIFIITTPFSKYCLDSDFLYYYCSLDVLSLDGDNERVHDPFDRFKKKVERKYELSCNIHFCWLLITAGW